MKPWIAIATAALLFGCTSTPEINQTKLPDEVRAQEIKDMQFGMFVCWSFSTFSGREWTPTLNKDASYFKATGCDTDQWCRTAKEAGMNYILFLPKHDNLCKPAEKIYADYQGAVKYENIFSLNIGPNYEGRLRDIDVQTLREVGEMIRAKNN